MTENQTSTLHCNTNKAEQFISDLFKNHLSEKLLYHNITHTSEVAEIVTKLGEKAGLKKQQLEDLEMAAWFHDSGYIQKYTGHEDVSAEIAEDWLKEEGLPDDRISHIKALILSTKKEHTPETLEEELLYDADIAHVGRKRFFRKGELLRVEYENFLNKTYSELEWEELQYDFLVNHHFITKEAKDKFDTRRVKNIKEQRKNILKARKVTVRENTGKDFGRGIDTLYRSNYRSHINLSAIADGKANMMISINTILISVIVTLSGASLSMSKGFEIANLRFTVPILILLIGALISVVFAVLSARPKVTQKKVEVEKAERNNISLLYFGNFLGIPKDDFIRYLNDLKRDQEKLYNSMSVDIYNLGAVLKEKYRMLSISYNIFMAGLCLTVLAFLVIFLYTNI